MAILDIIEFLDPTGRQIVHRVPEYGSGDFKLGSQCIVRRWAAPGRGHWRGKGQCHQPDPRDRSRRPGAARAVRDAR